MDLSDSRCVAIPATIPEHMRRSSGRQPLVRPEEGAGIEAGLGVAISVMPSLSLVVRRCPLNRVVDSTLP